MPEVKDVFFVPRATVLTAQDPACGLALREMDETGIARLKRALRPPVPLRVT